MKLPDGQPMFAADEFELSGANDVADVLRWAKQHSEGRTYTIYAVIDGVPTDRGLVQVFGVDPTQSSR